MAEVDDIQARLQNDIQNRDKEIQARDTEILRLRDQINVAERDFRVGVFWTSHLPSIMAHVSGDRKAGRGSRGRN
mgnify:CR=1 FL=1